MCALEARAVDLVDGKGVRVNVRHAAQVDGLHGRAARAGALRESLRAA